MSDHHSEANPLIQPAQELRQRLVESDVPLTRSELLPLMRALRLAETGVTARPADAPHFGKVHTEEQAAAILQTSVETLARRRKTKFYKEDRHYCWRAGRIVYSDRHLEAILSGEGFEEKETRKRNLKLLRTGAA